jgi:hypothetical protein
MERVDQQGSDACLPIHGVRPVNSVQQQGRANMISLGAAIDCQSYKHQEPGV